VRSRAFDGRFEAGVEEEEFGETEECCLEEAGGVVEQLLDGVDGGDGPGRCRRAAIVFSLQGYVGERG
jgi:hypothetical protein